MIVTAFVLSGCVNANDVANRLGQPPEQTSRLRAMETRRFDTRDDVRLISTATQTMQDLGFIVSESSLEGGLVTGAKQRDAKETGQIAGQIALTVLFAATGRVYMPVWDDNQTIQATIVSYPVEGADASDVRVSFDRVVVNTKGMRRAEFIDDEKIYREFFQRYSTALALEGHAL
nr:hypothetical protein [uncultured Rhodopila sp.]